MVKYPLITAHSGCMNTMPNTVESVEKGLRAGADIVEVDVRATKDGVVVLMHDDVVDIPLHGICKIGNLTYEELVSENVKITRLDNVIDLVHSHNKIINLDLKDDRVVDPMVKTVESIKRKDSVILSGCGREKAFYITRNYKGFQVLLNAEEDELLVENPDYEFFIKKTCNDAVEVSCCGINIFYEACFEQLVDYASSRCLPVCVYTIDDISFMKKYIDMGVYSITTNQVEKLMSIK